MKIHEKMFPAFMCLMKFKLAKVMGNKDRKMKYKKDINIHKSKALISNEH